LRTTLQRIGAEASERIERLASLAAAAATEQTFPTRLHLNALTVRLQLEQELGVLRWTGWAIQQVAAWPTTYDAGEWNTKAILAQIVADSRAATAG
jgi:hypothetical protein